MPLSSPRSGVRARMQQVEPWKPNKEQLAAAHGKKVPDIVAPALAVLFCGINPGLYSGAVGHHFARPGNRFWPALHQAGFTERLLSPFEERRLLDDGLGVTNLVDRATGSAAELSHQELIAGKRRLERKVRRYRPAWIAFLGIDAYRIALGRKDATVGRQAETFGGAGIWVLPNPSGLNAHYQIAELARMFARLRTALDE